MAPMDEYLIADQNSEIALAHSAAPASISNGAEVMMLGRKGFTTAVKGTNGFLCVVERSWGAATDAPEFWNPKIRSPICLKEPALQLGAMCYMMSKQQYLNDQGARWHPHLMFFGLGRRRKELGADLPGSPIITADDPQKRTTILMVLVGNWSDGSPAPPIEH